MYSVIDIVDPANLTSQLKYRHRDKLLQELEAKKVAVENAIQSQVEHDVRPIQINHQ